jgi:hypothetical protein
MFRHVGLFVVILIVLVIEQGVTAAESPDKSEASRALQRAVQFFRTEVSANGGYLWQYSSDLSRREGEGKASETMVWVQPPGTPTVGEAFLTAYKLTKDDYLLEAATETAMALVKGQLQSGGWDYRIEFDPARRSKYAYRVASPNTKSRNTSTLDDNTTQAAMRFLMRVDQTLSFQNKEIHDAALVALDTLVKVQYPNGAWPQRFVEPPDPKQFPVKKASYPKTWPKSYPKVDYRSFYTFNDNTIADTVATMDEAAAIYADKRYSDAVKKAGDFLLLAQMPEPQPAWAQQYNADMHPAWARKFEPASITGGESYGVIRTLMTLYRITKDKKYLEPIPRALAYMKTSELPDGRLARFYELKTNRPLFFTKDYQVTYSSDDMPTHYGFIVGSWVDSAQKQYDRLLATSADRLRPKTEIRPPRMSESVASLARSVIDQMDERGAWVTAGRLKYHGDDDPTREIISCRTFVDNVKTLAQFIAAR